MIDREAVHRRAARPVREGVAAVGQDVEGEGFVSTSTVGGIGIPSG
jgi:hypothetical protein